MRLKSLALFPLKYVLRMNYQETDMKDPIVEEVRKARQDHARKFDYNLSEICNDLKKIEKASGHRIVSLSPTKLKKIPKASSLTRSSVPKA